MAGRNTQANHELMPLPYDYDALDGISKDTVTFHHDKHHAGYVTKWNEIEKALQGEAERANANANYSRYAELKRRESFNAAGTILHDLYWQVLGGTGGEPGGRLKELLERDFGSYEGWKKDFIAAASSVPIGWAVLVHSKLDGRLHNYVTQFHHDGVLWGAHPLLAVDVWEHAYYFDQGPDRAKYLEAFFRNLNWDVVEARLERCPWRDMGVIAAPGEHRLPELPYAYDALDGISKDTVTFHHDKHHAGYVTKLNEIEKKLREVDRGAVNANYSEYAELKRRETFNASGVALHNIYWEVLGGNGGEARGPVAAKLRESFGSVEEWLQDFRAAATSTPIGWAVLAYFPGDGQLRNIVTQFHQENSVWGAYPVLPLDVWEHAYYFDQGPDRAKYVDAFLRNLNWDRINERFAEAEKLGESR